jgi:hypothetical protein
MKSEHSKRFFGTGRHTAVLTNGALPLSRKGCTLGARLQLAELIFPTGTHFKLPFNIICEIQDRLHNIVYEHHAPFQNSDYPINTAVALASFQIFFNFTLHNA